MQNLETGENKPPTMSLVRILWAAFVFSQVIYVVVAFAIVPPRGAVSMSEGALKELAVEGGAAGQSTLTWHPYALMALATLIASYFIPRVILASAKTQMPNLKPNHAMLEVPLAAVLKAAFTPFLIRIALIESISIFGLAASFVLRTPELGAYFTAVSLTAMAMNFPTEGGMRGMLGL